MNTDEIKRLLDRLLPKVEKPGRYIGGEPHCVIKDPADVKIRFGFCFPDTYEIGMSYMGLQLLYHIVNSTDHTWFERCFAPASDMEALMRSSGLPLYTLESKTALRDMDIVGFTLQYELSYTNILNMLDLAGIPRRSRDRGEDMPLVVAGGPCAFNAEPLADFFDVIMVGDGEELLPELCRVTGEWKGSGESKRELLKRLSRLQGAYVPSFYEAEYAEDGSFAGYKKLEPSAPDRVLRAIIDGIDDVDYPTENIVPLIEVVHDRAVCELFRGCTRGCRFCQAGMIYRPVRERSMAKNLEIAKKQLEISGHDELSLLSLSTSDYTEFEPLVLSLIDYCKPRNISISLPSLRLDNFSFRVLDEIQGIRKTGLTFAPEAGTQRLRDVINKNITEPEILGAIDKAIDLGWRSVKLYFMIGLPTETDEDLDGIVDLARKISDLAYAKKGNKGGGFHVSMSAANFIPKPFTPFQWCPQCSEEEFERKHFYIKDRLRGIRGVSFHYHGSYTSRLEAIFARGGRELCRTLERAADLGCSFDAWTEGFKEDAWKQALADTGIDESYFALNAIDLDAPLPWNIIDSGISDEFFRSEYEKSVAETTTPDCRRGCNNCGINRYTECRWGGIYV